MRFARSYTLPKIALPTLRAALCAICIILGGYLFSSLLTAVAVIFWWSASLTIVSLLVTYVGVLALLVRLAVSQHRKAWVGELIVDRSGLTVQRKPMGAHLPWWDITQV